MVKAAGEGPLVDRVNKLIISSLDESLKLQFLLDQLNYIVSEEASDEEALIALICDTDLLKFLCQSN